MMFQAYLVKQSTFKPRDCFVEWRWAFIVSSYFLSLTWIGTSCCWCTQGGRLRSERRERRAWRPPSSRTGRGSQGRSNMTAKKRRIDKADARIVAVADGRTTLYYARTAWHFSISFRKRFLHLNKNVDLHGRGLHSALQLKPENIIQLCLCLRAWTFLLLFIQSSFYHLSWPLCRWTVLSQILRL